MKKPVMEKYEIDKQVELYSKMQNCLKELQNIQHEVWENSMAKDAEWRNVKLLFWREICQAYKEEDLLNCYGDVFFIEDKTESAYIGRRVLWNLGLSKETYIIYEIKDVDCDGEYTYTDYQIEILGEN